MSGKRIGESPARAVTDWERLRNLTDAEVQRAAESDPDARPTDAEFWKNAHLVIPKAKQTITIRLDADLLAWLRRQRGYQTRVNAVLRTYMDAHLDSERRGTR